MVFLTDQEIESLRLEDRLIGPISQCSMEDLLKVLCHLHTTQISPTEVRAKPAKPATIRVTYAGKPIIGENMRMAIGMSIEVNEDGKARQVISTYRIKPENYCP